MTKVCYFGTYSTKVVRTLINITGLQAHGIQIVECNVPLPQSPIQPKGKITHFIRHIVFGLLLIITYLKLAVKFFLIPKDCKYVIVGYPFKYEGIIAALLGKICRKKVIIDYYMSLHETHVVDRQQIPPHSWQAKELFLTDYLTVHLVDKLIVDSEQHAKYFIEQFHANIEKFITVPIGAYIPYFKPSKKPKSYCFEVVFWGNFIPLQGVEYIIKAANLLQNHKDIRFALIGKGQTFNAMQKLAEKLNCKNVRFLGSIPFNQLSRFIIKADVCLGIFGNTVKTQLVIPNKAYEAIAMRKPLLTALTPAILEVFTPDKNCIVCKHADEISLADAIIMLKNSPNTCKAVADEGYTLFINKFTPEKVVTELVEYLRC